MRSYPAPHLFPRMTPRSFLIPQGCNHLFRISSGNHIRKVSALQTLKNVSAQLILMRSEIILTQHSLRCSEIGHLETISKKMPLNGAMNSLRQKMMVSSLIQLVYISPFLVEILTPQRMTKRTRFGKNYLQKTV